MAESTTQEPRPVSPFAVWQAERSSDPRGYYANLRKEGRIDFKTHRWAGGKKGPTAAVLHRDDIGQLLRDVDTYSSEVFAYGPDVHAIPQEIQAPLHTTYRRLLDPLFSPKKMAELQPKVEVAVNKFIDAFIDNGEVEVNEGLAVPLPCMTFLDLLGLPSEELQMLIYWKDVLIRPEIVGGSFSEGQRIQAEVVPQMFARFAQEVEDRKVNPRDDLITYFTTTEVDGRKLTEEEQCSVLFFLLAAGLDTVTISLQAMFYYIATHPETQQLLHDDPSQVENVVEELLRWETPVMSVMRVAKEDTELGGCPISKGTFMVACLASGNVEEEVPESLNLDLTRGDKAHLAFGAGPHRCLGSHLARMELRTVIREWHKRIPFYEVKPGETIEWVPSALRGIDYLPLQWKTKG